MIKTKIRTAQKFPALNSLGVNRFFVVDHALRSVCPWLVQRLKNEKVYWVKAGEQLKSLDAFPEHVRSMQALLADLDSRDLTVVAIGGGSVGDFSGFFASVYKRGVQLVHIPSTWLAAIDSAHGGKTALNSATAKNQIGTFYAAKETILVKDLLMTQGQLRVFESVAELNKIALIAGNSFWKNWSQQRKLDGHVIFKFLPVAIAAKMKIVNQDPYEQKGVRQILNLGHTLGHVLETHWQIPHGIAVHFGLEFALEWSVHAGLLKVQDLEKIWTSNVWIALQNLKSQTRWASVHLSELLEISNSELRKLLEKDKKLESQGLGFILLAAVGKPKVVKTHLDEVILEVHRQRNLER